MKRISAQKWPQGRVGTEVEMPRLKKGYSEGVRRGGWRMIYFMERK
jgi:hypothetical protein